jgi:1-acyl-sn-glycerol-3-phosphate acyltransferase
MTDAPRPSVSQRFATQVLALCGWKVETGSPAADKYILVVYPHTSNWDFPFGYLAKMSLGLKLHWVGKHSLFRWPFGPLARWLGGIPVNRRSRNNVIDQMAARFRTSDQLIIAITPEGTRSRTEAWKSGFYHIARGAGVPLALAYIDYGRKRMGISPPFELSGDVEADLAHIRAFYADKQGRYPDQAGEIRFLSRADDRQGS